jgi:hypothetical protein
MKEIGDSAQNAGFCATSLIDFSAILSFFYKDVVSLQDEN